MNTPSIAQSSPRLMSSIIRATIGVALLMSITLAVPAQAAIFVAGSVGSGFTTSPMARTPTNIMIAPGWAPIDLLRVELGIVGDLGDVRANKFDLQLRPSAMIEVPILPLFARVILGVRGLLSEPAVAWGGGIGTKFGIGPISVFAELDMLPRTEANTLQLEFRLGAMLGG